MIEKSAGILGALGKASLSVGKSAIKSPMKTVGTVMGVSGAVNAAKKGLESNPVAPQSNQRFVNKKYVTANEILNGIDKKAKENNDKKEIGKDVAVGAVGAKMLHSSKDKILGQKTLYHGTSSKNWENIKKEGLRTDKGGINGAGNAIKSDLYKNDSKNKVHATAKKWKADMYSRIGESSDKVNKTPEAKKYTDIRNKLTDKDGKIVFNGTDDEIKKQVKSFRKAHKDFTKVQFKEMAKNKGKVAKIKMDYNKYKKMEVDPFEQGQAFGNLAKKVKNKGVKEVLNNIGKDFAARGNVNITPDEIVGLHNPAERLAKTVKNIPHYAKTNKGRFGTGLALAGTGGVLMGKSVKDIKNKMNLVKNEEKSNIKKEAKENNDKKEIKKDIATGAIGAKMLHSSKDKILGQKTLYHGTSSKNWESIKKEGLRADKGGIGGFGQGTDSVDLANDSKGMVHVTGKKNKAKMYAKAGDALDNVKKTPEYKRLKELNDRIENDRASLKDFEDFSVAEANFNKAKVKQLFESKGKVAKIKMDYNKYKKMEVAPHETGAIYSELAKRTKNKNVKKMLIDKGKHVAARGSINITPDEIVGLHNPAKRLAKTVKNIPHYAKTNKGRFGAGLALAGTGGTLMNKSIKDIKNKMNKEANLKEDAKNLGIGIAGGILTNIAQDQWQLARDRKNKKDQWELTKSLAKNKKKEGEVKMDIQKKASEILKEAACKTSACKTAVCKKGACKTAEGCGTEGQNMEQDAACGDKKAACKTSACKTASEMLEEILAKKAEEEVEKEAGECGGKGKMCGKPEGKGCKMEEDDDMEDDDDDEEECEGKECKMKQEGACKKASEVLEEAVIEKEAGIGSIVGKIGTKVTSMGGVSGIANKAKNLGGDYVAAMKGKGAVAARADKQAANAANKLGDAIKSGANDATKNNLFQNYTKTRQQSDKAIVDAGKRVALARGGTGVVGAAGLGAAMKNRQMEQNGACKKASEDLDKAVLEKEAAAGAMPGGVNNAPKKFIGKGLGVAGAGLGAAGLVAAGIAKMKANKPNVPSNNPTMQQTSACKTAEEIEQEAACKTSEMEKETACKTAVCKKGACKTAACGDKKAACKTAEGCGTEGQNMEQDAACGDKKAACKTAEGCGTEGQNMEQDAACGDKKAACKTSACKTASEDFIKDTFESALIKTANEMCGEVEKKATTQKDIDDKFRELFNTLNW